MNLRALDLNLLVVLDALLSERHVTRAGQRLGLSQPATSNALKRLRRMFGDALLERTPRGLELTARAQALREPLAEVLREVSTLVGGAPVVELSQLERTVRLSVADYGVAAFVGPLLESLAARAPGIDVVCLPWSGADDAHAALDDGSLDLAVSVLAPANLRFRPIVRETYVVALRERHPALPLTLARWLAHPHVVVSGRGSSAGPLDTVLAERGLRRRVGVIVPSFLAVPSLLVQSDCIALIPERLARLSTGIVWAAPPLPVPGFDVALVWHPRSDADAAVGFVRDEMVRLASEASTPKGAATEGPKRARSPSPAKRASRRAPVTHSRRS
ncbi:MAG TPA: LysR substrate-binding domain-containing protein [Polyangiaceae bacterium]|nr:LysR substrate-binding domain-containing protein [Polyangiaceae bacterium]